MRDKMNQARAFAFLIVVFVVLMGWINPSGKDAFAQYYCTVSCSATAPSTGAAGSSLTFGSTVTPYYCEGTPTYNWDFGDGTNSTSPSPAHTYAKGGTYSWSVTVTVDDASATRGGSINITATTNSVKGVSAASFDGAALTSEAIVATFGVGLATSTQIATSVPLPTNLAGTTVKVKDSAGTERLAPLFFVSTGQINHQIPPGTAAGTATITITSGDGTVSIGTAQIASVAPGLFSANASGQGVPSGYVLRLKADNSQSVEPIAQYDAAQGKYVAVPIDLGVPSDQVFLILFGTGIRFRSALSAVTSKFGGTDAQVLFAGPQGDFVGLDQLNIQLPKSLAGRGEIDGVLTVDSKTANTVRIAIK